MTQLVKIKGVELTPVALKISKEIDFKEWIEIGLNLREEARAIPFWIGDWVLYGEKHYGEEHSQAFDPTKGYDTETIRKYRFVCKTIPNGKRFPKLSFSHHLAVCHLVEKERNYWLGKAEENDWSSRELRDELSEKKQIEKVDKEECPYWQLRAGKYICVRKEGKYENQK